MLKHIPHKGQAHQAWGLRHREEHQPDLRKTEERRRDTLLHVTGDLQQHRLLFQNRYLVAGSGALRNVRSQATFRGYFAGCPRT